MTVTRQESADDRPLLEQEIAVLPAQQTGARVLHWGPIFAGFLTALGTFVMLSMLAVGLGVTAMQDGTNVGPVARIVGAVIALLSFVLGGLVASWSHAFASPGRGALAGFLVWALWLLVILIAGALGLGRLFGAAGLVLDLVRTADLSQQEVLQAVRTGSLGGFLALALAATAAILGGVLGTNDNLRSRWESRRGT